MRFHPSQVGVLLGLGLALGGGSHLLPPGLPAAQAQAGDTITLRSDIQEANTNTGVITARGNVQIDYPAQQIRATSAQADYYSNERRIVLSGNVLVNQQGNTLRAEVVTYLIDEGRFVALPSPNEQVEAIYQFPASSAPGPQPPTGGSGNVPRPPVVLDVSPVGETPPSSPLGNLGPGSGEQGCRSPRVWSALPVALGRSLARCPAGATACPRSR